MLHRSPRRTIVTFVLAFIFTPSHVFSEAPSEPADDAGSVDKLRMLLHSIDPYLPKETVSGEIKIFGSSTMDGLAHAWGENFREFHPDICLEVTSTGDSAGAERMKQEPEGLWMVSRPVTLEELDSLRSSGVKEPVAFEVARQALGVFVHPSNPITSISGEQLRAVFADDGKQTPTWRLLGAANSIADQPVKIVSRDGDSGTQRFLQDHIFGAKMRAGIVVTSNANVVKAIEKDPLTIGICGLRCGSVAARSLHLEAGGNVIPSDDLAILSGQYPLIRPLYIVMDLSNPEGKRYMEFIRYILSQSGQAENVLAGYYPVDLPLIRAGTAKLHESQANLR